MRWDGECPAGSRTGTVVVQVRYTAVLLMVFHLKSLSLKWSLRILNRVRPVK